MSSGQRFINKYFDISLTSLKTAFLQKDPVINTQNRRENRGVEKILRHLSRGIGHNAPAQA